MGTKSGESEGEVEMALQNLPVLSNLPLEVMRNFLPTHKACRLPNHLIIGLCGEGVVTF